MESFACPKSSRRRTEQGPKTTGQDAEGSSQTVVVIDGRSSQPYSIGGAIAPGISVKERRAGRIIPAKAADSRLNDPTVGGVQGVRVACSRREFMENALDAAADASHMGRNEAASQRM